MTVIETELKDKANFEELPRDHAPVVLASGLAAARALLDQQLALVEPLARGRVRSCGDHDTTPSNGFRTL